MWSVPDHQLRLPQTSSLCQASGVEGLRWGGHPAGVAEPSPYWEPLVKLRASPVTREGPPVYAPARGDGRSLLVMRKEGSIQMLRSRSCQLLAVAVFATLMFLGPVATAVRPDQANPTIDLAESWLAGNSFVLLTVTDHLP